MRLLMHHAIVMLAAADLQFGAIANLVVTALDVWTVRAPFLFNEAQDLLAQELNYPHSSPIG